MGDPRLACILLDSDDVNAPVIEQVLLRVVLRASQHMRLFARPDCKLWRSKAPGRSCLDLDEDSEMLLASHKIDLSVGCAQIALQHFVAAPGEIIRRNLFSPAPDALISTHRAPVF